MAAYRQAIPIPKVASCRLLPDCFTSGLDPEPPDTNVRIQAGQTRTLEAPQGRHSYRMGSFVKRP
jgi:hypothetical protein